MCGLMMLQMSAMYTFISLALMTLTYAGLRRSRRGERGLTAIFQGTMFQLTRRLQIALQKSRLKGSMEGWRPSIVAVTRNASGRLGQFDLLRWICHRHGFGHFIQFVEGNYSHRTEIEARRQVGSLIERAEVSRAGIFVDSLICPSFQMALGQTLQLPGISGLPNNCILFEFDRDRPEEADEVAQGALLVSQSKFNVLILRSARLRFGYRSSIHVWVTQGTRENAAMMLLLAYIIVGHTEWRKARIRLFACFEPGKAEREASRLSQLMTEGRLPISRQNLTAVSCSAGETMEREVERRSGSADLVIAGLQASDFERGAAETALMGLRGANDVLFVHSSESISIS